MSVFRIVVVLVLMAVFCVVSVATWPGRSIYWKSSPQIEEFLLRELPLGTSQAMALAWLRAEGTDPTIQQAHLQEDAEFEFGERRKSPGGNSVTTVTLAEYALPFTVSVEAMFVFDGNGNLAAAWVRKSVDSF